MDNTPSLDKIVSGNGGYRRSVNTSTIKYKRPLNNNICCRTAKKKKNKIKPGTSPSPFNIYTHEISSEGYIFNAIRQL